MGSEYNGSIELISGLKQANGQDFPLMEAHAVQVDENGTRLDEALKNVGTDKRKGKHRQVTQATLWYHNLYEWGNTDEEASARLAKNEVVVAGGSLWGGGEPSEADKNRQIKIIQDAKKLNPNLKFFYYITIASWRNDGGWQHILGKGGYWDQEEANKHNGAVRIHTKWEMYQMLEKAAHIGGTKSGEKEYIEDWTWTDDDGVEHTEAKYIDKYTGGISLDGCFYDDAGMENTEGRINQGFTADLRQKYIDLVNFTHSRGLAAFPNQLHPDWYSDEVMETNPEGKPSSIGEGDYMLLESCHSQVGYEGKPLWRHVNGTNGVYEYYQNWYPKVGAKVVVNDYLYGTGGGSGLSDEEFYELATYLLCDTLCCGGHYIDLNGLLTWEYPYFFDDLLIPEDQEYDITRKAKGHYILHANGHTLEVIRGENLQQGETVTLKSLNKVYIYYDGIRIKNGFKKLSQYSYETDQRLDTLDGEIEEMKKSTKSTANIYHRMMLDDWGKNLVYTNFVTESKFLENLQADAKNIMEIAEVREETNGLRLIRKTNGQINEYCKIDITEKKGHRIEVGFTVNEATNWAWGFNGDKPCGINWTYFSTGLNKKQKSSYYGDDFEGYITTVTIPEETEEETWTIRFCYNGSVGDVYDFDNFYMIDLDEFGEDITKEWYTQNMPTMKSAYNNPGYPECYTLETPDDYSFTITWDKEPFSNWSGLRWDLPNGTFQAGHTYEIGCVNHVNNAGGANIAFRAYTPAGENWIPKGSTFTSQIYKETRFGKMITIPESATSSSGYLTFTNTCNTNKNGSGEYISVTIEGLYIYDVNEENIVLRGSEPSNSYLQICRVTEEKLATDTKLIGNALYITDAGKLFMTDFNGNETDLAGSIYAGAVEAGYEGSPSDFGASLYDLISRKE